MAKRNIAARRLVDVAATLAYAGRCQSAKKALNDAAFLGATAKQLKAVIPLVKACRKSGSSKKADHAAYFDTKRGLSGHTRRGGSKIVYGVKTWSEDGVSLHSTHRTKAGAEAAAKHAYQEYHKPRIVKMTKRAAKRYYRVSPAQRAADAKYDRDMERAHKRRK